MMDQQTALELFNYVDGELYWNKTGKLAGWTSAEGRRKVGYKGAYYVHQIIFLMHKGYIPKLIDHDDRDKLNNRIENLIDRTHQENSLNRGPSKTNKVGIKTYHGIKLLIAGEFRYVDLIRVLTLDISSASAKQSEQDNNFRRRNVKKYLGD